jgi:hypothetical protein
MKELIEGLLFVALLKFLGVPMWLISLGSVLFLIGFFAYMFLQSADSRIGARELAVAAAREKQQAEEIKEAERARQEAIADAEWNARFV